ncbi:MAG: OmpA family protein, partial [Roseicyclus sp.]
MVAARTPPLRRRLAFVALCCVVAVPPALAFDLTLPPGAVLVRSDPPRPGSHDVATAVWTGSDLPLETVSGPVSRTIWTLPAREETGVSTLAAGISERLRAGGAEILLSCSARACGGFDFRSRLDLGRSPEMLVDIGNFHYLSARAGEETIAITVSQGGGTLYVHSVTIGAEAATGPWETLPEGSPEDSAEPGLAGPPSDIASRIARLPETGAVTLDDLFFRTGASDLSGQDYPSLIALSRFLSENPDRRIVLVGHTDTVGGLDGNVALSRARAEAVRAHLIEALGVDPDRLEATG